MKDTRKIKDYIVVFMDKENKEKRVKHLTTSVDECRRWVRSKYKVRRLVKIIIC